MNWRTAVAAGLGLALAVLVAAAPALADSYTWGYGYSRTRATLAPVASDALPAATGGAATGLPAPFVVPLPGQSQSTPVVVDHRWYLWTYWDGGLRGALWTGTLDPADGASSPGRAITLPGASGPVVAVPADSGQRLDEPADAAVSPDGRWVAFGVGSRLYFWPAGAPAAGAWAGIAGPGHVEANSTSPTFVPDAGSPSGWEVCDGNWDGGFACFAVGADQPLVEPTAGVYQVEWSTPADADGYAAITSSAAYGGPRRRLYFGVASAHDPRVIALDPRSGRYLVMDGGGAVRAPIWSAVALAGNAVFATDVDGTPYRFDARSGRLQAVLSMPAGVVDIDAPAVGAGAVFVLAPGGRDLLALDPTTLAPEARTPVGAGSGPATAPTVVSDAGAAPEIFAASDAGGVGADAFRPSGGMGSPTAAFLPLAAWPGAPAGGIDTFTAAVVSGDFVLLWSDGAAAQAGQVEAAAPPGFAPVRGGLQVYRLRPRLSAAILPSPAVVGQGPSQLDILAPPGAAVTVDGGAAGPTTARPAPADGTPCPVPLAVSEGPSWGVFPWAGVPSPGPSSGCGPAAGALQLWAAAAALAAGQVHPAFAGATPQAWQSAGVGFDVWSVALPVPQQAGAQALTVAATMSDGDRSQVVVWRTAVCPPGWAPVPSGACAVPVTVTAAAPGDPGAAGSRCPPDLAPGRNGWTPREFSLLCLPLPTWLVDPGVIACYGSWWNAQERQYAQKGCVMAGGGSHAGP